MQKPTAMGCDLPEMEQHCLTNEQFGSVSSGPESRTMEISALKWGILCLRRVRILLKPAMMSECFCDGRVRMSIPMSQESGMTLRALPPAMVLMLIDGEPSSLWGLCGIL